MTDHGPGFTVAHVVPPVFAAYGRMLRPTRGGRRWAEIAAQSGARLTATTRYEDITRLDIDDPVEGVLSAAEAAVVAEVLREFTGTPDRCLFLVGGRTSEEDLFGDLVFSGTPHVMLTGDVLAAAALHARTTADAWWPADRAWFVYTNADGFDTHLGGSAAAIAALIDDGRLEVLPLAADDPVDISPEWGRPD